MTRVCCALIVDKHQRDVICMEKWADDILIDTEELLDVSHGGICRI
jgi:hypothetical protein